MRCSLTLPPQPPRTTVVGPSGLSRHSAGVGDRLWTLGEDADAGGGPDRVDELSHRLADVRGRLQMRLGQLVIGEVAGVQDHARAGLDASLDLRLPLVGHGPRAGPIASSSAAGESAAANSSR